MQGRPRGRIPRLAGRWLASQLRRVRGWLRALRRRRVRARRRARDLAELGALDARALQDAGLSRSDLPAILDGRYLADPTRRRRGRPRAREPGHGGPPWT